MLASEDHTFGSPAYSGQGSRGVYSSCCRPVPFELAMVAGLPRVEEATWSEGQRSWESHTSGLSLRRIAAVIFGWWQHETLHGDQQTDKLPGWLGSLLSGGVLMWGDLFPHSRVNC